MMLIVMKVYNMITVDLLTLLTNCPFKNYILKHFVSYIQDRVHLEMCVFTYSS